MMSSHTATVRRLGPAIAGVLPVALVAALLFPVAAAAQGGSPPDRPAPPTVTAVAHDSVTISWADPSDAGITGYQILRRDRDVDAMRDFTVIEDDTGSAEASYTDMTAEAATRYVYRVKARNADGLSRWSRFVRADTPAEPDPQPAQQNPAEPDPQPAQQNPAEPDPQPAQQELDTTGDAVRAAATDLGDITYFPREQAQQGTLDGAAQAADYYRFSLAATRTVEVSLRRQDADGDLVLEDSDGTVLAESRSPGSAVESIAKRLEAGTYYVRAAAQDTGTNAYELRYRAVPNSTPLDLGGFTAPTVAAAVGGAQNPFDSYQFTLDAERAVHLLVRDQQADTDLFLENPAGTVIRASRTAGTADELIEATLSAGTWYAVIRPQQAGANSSYVFSYRNSDPTVQPAEAGPDDYPDQAAGAARLPVGATVKAQIETSADEDWFAVALEGGQTYRMDLTGPAQAHFHEVRDEAENVVSEESPSDQTGRAGAEEGSSDVSGRSETQAAPTVAKSTGNPATGWTGEDAKNPHSDGGDASSADARSDGSDESSADARSDGSDASSADARSDGSDASAPSAEDSILFGFGWAQFKPEKTGMYYVGTRSDKGTGDYALSLRQLSDDYSADTTTAGTVAVDGTATGDIESARDRDWFSVTLAAGKTYRIDLMGAQTSDGTLRDPYLAGIHNSGGTLISGTTDEDDGAGTNSRVDFTATTAGAHYVAAGGAGNRTGTYTLSVTEIPDDHPAGTSTTGTVAIGSSTTGEIETEGDLDWFKVTLAAGKTYRFDLMGSWTGHGTLLNPHTPGIRNSSSGRVPDTSDNHGGARWNSRVDFAVATAGAYYYVAGGYGEGTYTLEVLDITDGRPDDYPADTSTTGTVAVGGSTTGAVEFEGDRDWFGVTLEAGRDYRFDTAGSGVGKGTLSFTRVGGVYDSSGTLLLLGNDDADGPRWSDTLEFTPATTGVHYVAATSQRDVGREGTYALTVTDMTPGQADDYTAATGTTGTVAVDGSATGRIEQAGDRDWFKVTLAASKVYRFDLKGTSTGDGTLGNPRLHGIRNSSGVLHSGTEDQDGGVDLNSRAFFTPAAAGTYFVDAGGHGAGTYVLAVTNITDSHADDFTATTGTSGTITVGGSETGDIGHPGDRDWFAVNLETGKIYQFDLKGAPTGDGLAGFGTLNDPHLYGIHNASGTIISSTTDDDGGWGNYARVQFTAAQTATHYVAAGGDNGTYTLFVVELRDDDHAAGTGTTGSVAVGGSATGEIETEGDVDWFEVTLEAGKTYRLDLKGARTRDGTLFDPYLNGIRNAAGNHIAGTDDDNSGLGLNSRATFAPGADGTFYVAAGADRDWTGSYTLFVTEA